MLLADRFRKARLIPTFLSYFKSYFLFKGSVAEPEPSGAATFRVEPEPPGAAFLCLEPEPTQFGSEQESAPGTRTSVVEPPKVARLRNNVLRGD